MEHIFNCNVEQIFKRACEIAKYKKVKDTYKDTFIYSANKDEFQDGLEESIAEELKVNIDEVNFSVVSIGNDFIKINICN